MLERYREALVALNRAVAAAKGRELLPALVNRAMVRESLGDLKGAYADLQAALAIDPAYAPALAEIARYARQAS